MRAFTMFTAVITALAFYVYKVSADLVPVNPIEPFIPTNDSTWLYLLVGGAICTVVIIAAVAILIIVLMRKKKNAPHK